MQHLTSLPGGNSEWEPPDPIPNSEVKTLSADGSVGSPHVRVGHRQALDSKSRSREGAAFFVPGVLGRGRDRLQKASCSAQRYDW